MKLYELFNNHPKQDLDEGGASGGARYNSEVAILWVLANNGQEWNPEQPSSCFDPSKLRDAEKTLAEVDRFLIPNYDEKIFNNWVNLAKQYIAEVVNKDGATPQLFGWAGGSNRNDDGVADIVFVGHSSAGISVKDVGGITLANLTPKAIGLEAPKGADLFHYRAGGEYIKMKTAIFNDVLADAKSKPDQAQNYGGTRSITYNSADDTFTCAGKKQTITATADKILGQIEQNANWQRVFGDWFQANWQAKKHYALPMYKALAGEIEKAVEEALGDNATLIRMLQFAEVPYYYATAKGLYYVPDASQATELRIKGIKYAEPDGTSQLFNAIIGRPDSEKNAEVGIYIRYANGMFESNPTVRVQSLKYAQFLGWEKLI